MIRKGQFRVLQQGVGKKYAPLEYDPILSKISQDIPISALNKKKNKNNKLVEMDERDIETCAKYVSMLRLQYKTAQSLLFLHPLDLSAKEVGKLRAEFRDKYSLQITLLNSRLMKGVLGNSVGSYAHLKLLTPLLNGPTFLLTASPSLKQLDSATHSHIDNQQNNYDMMITRYLKATSAPKSLLAQKMVLLGGVVEGRYVMDAKQCISYAQNYCSLTRSNLLSRVLVGQCLMGAGAGGVVGTLQIAQSQLLSLLSQRQ